MPEDRLFAPTTPGNAWDYYLPALASLSKISSREEDWIRQIGRGHNLGKSDRVRAEAAASLNSAQVDAIRKGVRCATGAWPGDREPRANGCVPEMDMADLIAFLAMTRWESGRRAEAIEIWGEMLQFGLDFCRRPGPAGSDGMWFRFGDNTIEQVLDVILPFVESYEFTPVEAGLLRSWLKIVDRQTPPTSWYVLEHINSLVDGILRDSEGPLSPRSIPRRALWRTAFSRDLAGLGAAEDAVEMLEIYGAAERGAWDPLVRTLESHRASILAGKNPASKAWFAMMSWSPRTPYDYDLAWEIWAKLKLFDAALAILESGEFQPSRLPLDPYTQKPIQYRESAEGLELWSVCRGGDQGGRGYWFVSTGELNADIVLRMKPRSHR